MELFYKGADIVLEMSLFSDEKRTTLLNLGDYIVDAVLYGKSGKIYLSSTGNGDIVLEVVNETCLQATIRSGLFVAFDCGVVHIDVRLKEKLSGLSVVDKECAFMLEDSKVKDI